MSDTENNNPEQSVSGEGESTEERNIKHLPTIEYFKKTYANSMGDDQKALRIFKDYESHEKLRRLQVELTQVKNGKVSEVVLERVLGLKRKVKHKSYEEWGKVMMLWVNSKR